IDSLLHLSRGIFGADFGSMASVVTKNQDKSAVGTYFRLLKRTFQEFFQDDLRKLFIEVKSNFAFKFNFDNYSKETRVIEYSIDGTLIYYPNISQSSFFKVPGVPFAYW